MAKLHFFYSTMNAGKSTALLQSNHNYKESNLKTLLFVPKSIADKSNGKIVSRIGLEADAIIVNNEYDFYDEIINPGLKYIELCKKHNFNLNYAPHLGMFKHHVGNDPIDQLNFMADIGFKAFEDNDMRNRDVSLQKKMSITMQKRDIDYL